MFKSSYAINIMEENQLIRTEITWYAVSLTIKSISGQADISLSKQVYIYVCQNF